MAWTVETTADYRSPRGRIVTAMHRDTCQTAGEAAAMVRHRWRQVRRRGAQLHAVLTADNGQTFRRTIRQD
jgi:phage gp16-like protein